MYSDKDNNEFDNDISGVKIFYIIKIMLPLIFYFNLLFLFKFRILIKTLTMYIINQIKKIHPNLNKNKNQIQKVILQIKIIQKDEVAKKKFKKYLKIVKEFNHHV